MDDLIDDPKPDISFNRYLIDEYGKTMFIMSCIAHTIYVVLVLRLMMLLFVPLTFMVMMLVFTLNIYVLLNGFIKWRIKILKEYKNL